MKNQTIIQKLISYIEKIETYCGQESYASFCANTQLVEACVFNLIQMGELVNRLDKNFADSYPQIPWHQIRGLRNRIVHDYEGVNLILVWDVISFDLPPLKQALKKLKKEVPARLPFFSARFYRFVPRKNSATVPGPECAPITGST